MVEQPTLALLLAGLDFLFTESRLERAVDVGLAEFLQLLLAHVVLLADLPVEPLAPAVPVAPLAGELAVGAEPVVVGRDAVRIALCEPVVFEQGTGDRRALPRGDDGLGVARAVGCDDVETVDRRATIVDRLLLLRNVRGRNRETST